MSSNVGSTVFVCHTMQLLFSVLFFSEVKINTTPVPLVHFKMNLPLPYLHMDPVPLAWFTKYQSLVTILFQEGASAFTVRKPQEAKTSADDQNNQNGGLSTKLQETLATDKVVLNTLTENSPRNDFTESNMAGHIENGKTSEETGSANQHMFLDSAVQPFFDEVNVPAKRFKVDCDLDKATLNMLVGYFRTGRLCGSRGLRVRFGLG